MQTFLLFTIFVFKDLDVIDEYEIYKKKYKQFSISYETFVNIYYNKYIISVHNSQMFHFFLYYIQASYY